MRLPVDTYDAPVLRQTAHVIEDDLSGIQDLVLDMLETVQAENGIGLAAPQVGRDLRIIIINFAPIDPSFKAFALINPIILSYEGKDVDVEGCLSLPGIEARVARAQKIRFSARKINGEYVEMEADGLLARVIQHEVDHLNGILFVDRLPALRKFFIRRNIKKLQNTKQ